MLIYQSFYFIKQSIYFTLKNIKISYKNNKLKISAPTWNKEFELPDGSYSVSNIILLFFCILFGIYLKRHETATDNHSIMIYINIIENRITFKITTWILS